MLSPSLRPTLFSSLASLCKAGVLMIPTLACAYEGSSHAAMTLDAFDRSVLADAQQGPLTRLGLDDPLTRTFTSSGVDSKYASGKARDIVAFGARFEDLPNPELRFLRHFFDPQNQGRGLTVGGAGPAYSSPDWELEDRGTISEQLHSLHDAQDFFYLALVSSDSAARERYLVLLLEAVGRGVHHLQDMAQPAHTRNAPHPLGLDGDLYERATERIASLEPSLFPQGVVYPTAAVDLHTFNAARKFWESAGLGMAELTATNFLSQDTNFYSLGSRLIPQDEFPLPAPVACEGRPLVNPVITTDLDLIPSSFSIPGTMWFVGTPVHDRYLSGSETTLCNERTSAYGLFDFDLEAIGRPKLLSLNRYTWEATRAILIPRAIAYSAGLINYFFRGALEIESSTETSVSTGTSGEITLSIRNQSLGDFALADGTRSATVAEFEVWYDSVDGARKPAQILQGGNLAGALIKPGESHLLRFVRPADLAIATATPLTLVFRGTIGTEEGVAAVAFAPRLNGFGVTRDDVAQGAPSRVVRLEHAADGWSATPDAAAKFGNVDWRGASPSDLVTWNGPQSRYFYAPGQVSQLSREIYSGGRLLAVAPGGVLGAAIRHSGALSELLAVVYQLGNLQVYARDLNADEAGPPQWRQIYSAPELVPSSPAFGNASGTEFQFITVDAVRIKLHVSLSSVTVERSSARGNGTQTGTYSTQIVPQTCGSDLADAESYKLVWAKPTVVCADYSGDTEVLCQLDAEEAMSVSQTLHRALEGLSNREVEALHKTGSTRRILNVGRLRIPITGSRYVTDASIDDTTYPFSDAVPAIDESQVLTTTDYDTPIFYLDARNDIAAFQETNGIRVTTSTYRGATRKTSGYFTPNTLSYASQMEVKLVVQHGDHTETLQSYSAPPTVQTLSMERELVNLPCGSAVPEDLTGALPQINIDDSTLDFSAFLHPRALQQTPTQGFAIDGAGNFLASFPMTSTDESGLETDRGVWNFLTDGNIAQLLPPSGTSAPPPSAPAAPAAPAGTSGTHYFPLGPLR